MLNKEEISKVNVWLTWLRDDNKKDVVFYIHNRVSMQELNELFNKTKRQKHIDNSDGEAHILATTNNSVEYRVGNEVYIVPAIIKAIVNNGDGKLNCWFDYPCEMKREDLVKY